MVNCSMDGIAPVAWIYGRAKIVVYREKAWITMKFTITSFLFATTGSLICPLGITIFHSNPTNGISYLVKSLSFKPNLLYRSGYMISTLLPWSIISFYKEPPNLEGHDQCIIMRLGHSFKVVVIKSYFLLAWLELLFGAVHYLLFLLGSNVDYPLSSASTNLDWCGVYDFDDA